MNTSDSERLSSAFEQMGFESAADLATADVVVLNTCVVRQSAEDTATGMLGRLAKIKQEWPGKVVAVMGCMVGPEQSELKRRFPHVDIWARPQQFAPVLETAGRAVLQPKQPRGQDGEAGVPRDDHSAGVGQGRKAYWKVLCVGCGCVHVCLLLGSGFVLIGRPGELASERGSHDGSHLV